MEENKANVLNLGRSHSHTVLKLSIPSIVEQMVFSLFAICDTAQVGALGAYASASVGILSPISWFLSGTISAMTIGFSVITAHSIGSGDMRKASRSANKSIYSALTLGSLITLFFLLLSHKIPVWMGAEEAIQGYSSIYMVFMSLSFFVNLLGTACSSTLRCTGETKVPLIINTVSIIINVILNTLFIFPAHDFIIMGTHVHIWGADLGVAGAGLATFISIWISTIFLYIAVLKNTKGIAIAPDIIFKKDEGDRELYRRAFSIGMPIFMERFIINSGQMIYMRCISTMGTASVAAHHLAVQAESFSYLPVSGIQVAVQTLLSQSMGAERYEDGEKFANAAAKGGFLYGIFAGVVLFFLGNPIMNVFTPDKEIAIMGAGLLKIVAFGEAVQSLDIVYGGALRGIGETKIPFYIGLSGIWGIRITFCLVATFILHLGINSAWVIMLIDMYFRGFMTAIAFKRKYKRIRK